MRNWHPQIHIEKCDSFGDAYAGVRAGGIKVRVICLFYRGAFAMIEMIKREINFFEREKNWKERTSDAPKAFSIRSKESIEDMENRF